MEAKGLSGQNSTLRIVCSNGVVCRQVPQHHRPRHAKLPRSAGNKYGWREEYTLRRFRGSAQTLVAQASLLMMCLHCSMDLEQATINVDECADPRRVRSSGRS